MSEVETGEYIRTNKGEIAKVIYNSTNEFCYTERLALDKIVSVNNSEFIYRDDMVKHSKNIIDLIEVGDYVNGYKVEQVFIDPFTRKKRLQIEGEKVNWQGDRSCVNCEAE